MVFTYLNSLLLSAPHPLGSSTDIARGHLSIGMKIVRLLMSTRRVRLLTLPSRVDKWDEFVPIPKDKTLEASETKLEDKTKFLAFMRRALAWDPNDRPTAKELLQDPWLSS